MSSLHSQASSPFPKHFSWGAATCAYQVEGAVLEDGRKPSTWDVMCRESGKIYENHHGDVACDHYHRYREDVALMKKLGLKAYRFSLAWPRIIPDGAGKTNKAGLDFYDRLVDALLEAGIEPWATLFHWDLPYDLYSKGGWLNPESSDWFADYAKVVVEKLSDRVTNWMTLNEPQCFIGLGLEKGIHAPGLKLGLSQVLQGAHNALLAHGKAVKVIRAYSKQKSLIGWAPVGVTAVPATTSEPDIQAAREAMFTYKSSGMIINPWDFNHLWNNTWWGDPVVFGKYPDDCWQAFGQHVPKIQSGDMETISQPIDFYGANIYNGRAVRQGENGPERTTRYEGFPLTAMRWPVTPECLYWGPKFLNERYKLPIVVTENGMSNLDWIALDDKVHDPQRIDFLTRYLRELGRAITDGVDIRGYFHWSLMDNFEWAEGYKERFGLIYVDYPTQKRIFKDSAYWYRDVIASNGQSLY